MTGSGKTAAFLLPILHRLIGKKRGVTRALILTPTRELAAQIDEHANELAVHTSLSSAAVFGGVGMGPQEHAFRTGVDILVATPGRLLDHFRFPYARLDHLEVLVLDEADRMLDMGFLPDIRRVLKHLPAKRQTLFFSATMPPPIAQLTREMLKNPFTVNLERSGRAGRRNHAGGLPGGAEPEGACCCSSSLKRGDIKNVLVFTRTKHRANRLAETLIEERRPVRAHPRQPLARRSARRRSPASRPASYRVLVATDIAARGIDVEALSHVVNFDVPHVPEDYIHRVGRTARAEMTGDAFTFVSPEEESGPRARSSGTIGKRLPRITVPGFDYARRRPSASRSRIAERIAAIRARKAEERKRAREKAERPDRQRGGPAQPRRPAAGRTPPRARRRRPARRRTAVPPSGRAGTAVTPVGGAARVSRRLGASGVSACSPATLRARLERVRDERYLPAAP